MSSGLPRDVLLKERWSSGSIEDLSIEYLNRGAPGDRSFISGSDIVHLGRSFMERSDGTKIPFHRVTAIFRNDASIWGRTVKEAP